MHASGVRGLGPRSSRGDGHAAGATWMPSGGGRDKPGAVQVTWRCPWIGRQLTRPAMPGCGQRQERGRVRRPTDQGSRRAGHAGPGDRLVQCQSVRTSRRTSSTMPVLRSSRTMSSWTITRWVSGRGGGRFITASYGSGFLTTAAGSLPCLAGRGDGARRPVGL